MSRTESPPADVHEDELGRILDGVDHRERHARSRRLLDLAISIPLAVLALPLVLVLAAVSACVFRASPLFMQARVGRGGRSFAFAKIRSLPADMPNYID